MIKIKKKKKLNFFKTETIKSRDFMFLLFYKEILKF